MIEPAEIFAEIYSGTKEKIGARTIVFWKVPRDLPYFNGHFPQSPIFPAIGIIDASLTVLQKALGQPEMALKSVPLAKFLSPIVPEQEVQIEWQALGESEWQVDWKDRTSAQILATMRLYA